MLSNYVNNALKFTDRGRVSVEAREVSSAGQNSVIEFSVSDTGIGIPESKRELLFKPFSQCHTSGTRQEGGTGLGLSIVNNLARLMGGEAGVESEEGKGSRFWFQIRANRCERAKSSGYRQAVRTMGDAVQAAFSGRHVLIVEDNAVNRFVVEAMLEQIGVAFESCVNGEQAVARTASEMQPDLVLMDCLMPVMDGYEATRRIRHSEQERRVGRLPIIVLTASAFDEDRQRCVAAGMNDFLTKPLGLQQLEGMLLKWLPARLKDEVSCSAS
jgi:two-component system, sensor histidine kinase